MATVASNDLSPSKSQAPRIASIDAFRGLTILVMIFVNNIPGVKNIPAWFKHMAPDANGMTFVDVVFPAFLFIVGMAIPFALGRWLDKGVHPLRVMGHVLIRTASLLFVGFFMVNMPPDSVATGLNGNVWAILAFLALMAAFNNAAVTTARGRRIHIVVRAIGFVALALLAYIYRAKSPDGLRWMDTSWWGIIGLIGWAYLVASVINILARRQMAALVGAMAMLYLVYLADARGLFTGFPLQDRLGYGSQLGSHGAITLAGVLVGQMLLGGTGFPTAHWARLRWIVIMGAMAFAAAVMFEPLHGINKTTASPAWCLYSVAWSCWIYAGLYLLMDVWGVRRWAAIVQPAGENPLLAYLLSTMLYYVLALWPSNPLWNHATSGYGALAVWAAVALAVTLLSGWLGRHRMALRL
ncbi:hypothetical protein CVU37_03380 [candidate division BRC1 bacterium HGW-BRC1-1]|nr:MAG: hypothetical protein CVU37_03380 [candidate division BRC1 bacterium HGW-BRC1-1]